MKLARNRQYTVRLMAPFNMRCKTCGEYIYKGKKFNARKEDVEGDDYLGIRIYRFYIKCTRCLQEISFKTDPKNTDYEIEAGATRNFMALKLAEEQAQREEDEEKEEEATNPMKLLEKRTQQSKQELELLESLEELKDLNRRQQTIDYAHMLEQFDTSAANQRTIKEQEELDEEFVKSVFKRKQPNGTVVEEEIVELGDEDIDEPQPKLLKISKDVAGSSAQGSKESVSTEEPSAKESVKPPAVPAACSFGSSSWAGNIASSSHNKAGQALVKKKTLLGVKTNSNSIGIASSSQTSSTTESTEVVEQPKATGLSLVGSYSGSSDNDSD